MLPEDVEHFVSSGANAVLPKPFRIADLEDLWAEHGIIETAETLPSAIEKSNGN